MSTEDPNKNFHWLNKLERLEYLPGETFNKDSAWNRLHGRLRGKRNNKKNLWYGMAAACLLLALMISFMNNNKGDQKSSSSQANLKQPKTTNVSNPIADKNKRTENINTDLPVKEKIVTVSKRSGQIKHSMIYDEADSKVRLNDIHSQTGPAIKTIPILDTNSTISIVLPAKKKLKVVHINELGDPIFESPDMTRNSDKHSFKLKLAREEIFVNSSVVSKTTGFTILKTKPFSN